MDMLLSPLDLVIFFGSLAAVMGLGLWAGRREETSEDYYLAGKETSWWGVAGSIFGSNVSANHIVGMMGVGFAVGFAQSHFEITAIAGLLMLCYGFLPVYRKLNVFTLSEYLSRRYNDGCRMAYAAIMVLIMVVIQMVPGFYIGSRSLYMLVSTGETATATAVVDASGAVVEVRVGRPGGGYASAPTVQIGVSDDSTDSGSGSSATAVIENGHVSRTEIAEGGTGYSVDAPPPVTLVGGASFDAQLSPGDVNPQWYVWGILLMAVVTGTYTILGGLKAVIVTDVIQSVLLLIAGMIVAGFTFYEIGGWQAMVTLDSAAAGGVERLHLYNPSNHKELPWSGVLTGLMVLHFFYWGTNQFIVQRALSARSDRQARMGIIAAGFFKLLIPFFAIGTGIAAFYLFRQRNVDVAQDAVFIKLLTELVAPAGYGLTGLVAAGMVGAILSSLDSMMNSAATIVTFDVYRRYVDPKASEARLIWVGRGCIVAAIALAACLTIFTMDPNSRASFFLQIASHQSRVIVGLVVAFSMGMLWKRSTGAAALVTIVSGTAFSYILPPVYTHYLADIGPLRAWFGDNLNFMHTVFVVALFSLAVHVLVSLMTKVTDEQAELTWVGLGIFTADGLRRVIFCLAVSLVLFAVLAVAMVQGWLAPLFAGLAAAVWTWAASIAAAAGAVRRDPNRELTPATLLAEDRLWGGLLAAVAIFMMYAFY